MGQYRYFHESLLNNLLTSFHYFQGQFLSCLVIIYFQYLSKWTLVNRLEDFIAVGYVIAYFVFVKHTSLIKYVLLGLLFLFFESWTALPLFLGWRYVRLLFLFLLVVPSSCLDHFYLKRSQQLEFSFLDLSQKIYPFVLLYLCHLSWGKIVSILWYHIFPLLTCGFFLVHFSLCLFLFLSLWMLSIFVIEMLFQLIWLSMFVFETVFFDSVRQIFLSD